jgi:hypothetical protein
LRGRLRGLGRILIARVLVAHLRSNSSTTLAQVRSSRSADYPVHRSEIWLGSLRLWKCPPFDG